MYYVARGRASEIYTRRHVAHAALYSTMSEACDQCETCNPRPHLTRLVSCLMSVVRAPRIEGFAEASVLSMLPSPVLVRLWDGVCDGTTL